jgi:hypothetical protein
MHKWKNVLVREFCLSSALLESVSLANVNDIIGSAKGSQISEKYCGEGEKGRYLP